MSKSKIALVTMDYPPEHGGVARYLGNLVDVAGGAIDAFVPVSHATSGPGRVQQGKFFRTVWPQWLPLVRLIHSLGVQGYEQVLVSHALPVGTAAMLSRWLGGPRYVVLLHGLDLRLAMLSRWRRFLLSHVLRNASLVLANSAFTAGEVKAIAGIGPQILTPGVEEILFPSPERARDDLSVEETECLILSVTRLVPRKGIDRLLEVLESFPTHVRLVIVGDGTDRPRLEKLAASLGRRVTFVVQATDAERNRWYAAADIFALPVRDEGRDVEGFGIVYLEAALAGLPVVAGRSGGASEAVAEGETGFLVDPADTRELAAALAMLVRDATLRLRMGQAGRKRALRDFCWKDRWETLRSLLEKSS